MALLVGCSESKKQDANHANEHMHQSSFEELVERFEDPERATWQKPELVINLMNINTGQTIADIGAGTGYFSFPIAKRGAEVVAIDVDEKFLQYITQKKDSLHKVEIRLSEYDDPLLALHEVDKALMVNVAHHIEKRAKYFNKVRKGLKVGGSFYIVDFK
ncbi:MAG: class I SAM-dependent methyltransferase, partial [Bacteroidetes bacterium]|nr:class I SAM-dependent methyltransferase [Bacteroidota bacterium]